MTNKFKVHSTDHQSHIVAARHFKVERGVLLFYADNNSPIQSFAEGFWTRVELVNG